MATILIIDDSETLRAEIRDVLEKERIFDSILEAHDGYRGLKLLLAERVDVVLCDLELPGLDGEKLLRVKSSSPGGANIPFLFLTASTDLDRKARLLDGGACDAIAKPFHPADLVARLKLHLKVKRLQDELILKNVELEHMSSVDVLTGLRTRRFVFDLLSVEFLRARRYGTALSVMMADLDHFKALNDEFGHPGGDAVLRGVSEHLIAALRRTDVAGRYGGEEVIVVMPQSDLEGAATLADRWRCGIEAASFVVPDGRNATVTVSIGVTSFDPSFETPEDLIAAADSALYQAKENGRNRVEIAR
jgi:two-component system cell cycle response regulator